jgi:gliding motility-associated-like protein
LPAGVTGTFAGGVITITGTPSVSGTFNYTVSTTGPCVKPTAAGTITVTEDATLVLTSAAGTNGQTICINMPLTNITYAVGGSGNGGSVTGLPAGVSGTYAGGVIAITGTSSVSGTFNYTVLTNGPCVKPTAAGVITVTEDATLSLTSGAATNNQTICINTPLTNITYAVGGTGTGGSVSGLPAGVTGTYAAGVITITGTPSVSGTFIYAVTTTGPCFKPGTTGTITVTADATITLLSAPATTSQALCLNATITNITYAVGGTGTGGTVTGLPAGVTGTYVAGVVTISGTPSASGTFNYTVNTTGPCVKPTAVGTITVYALPTLNFTSTAPSCETRLITFTDNTNPNVGTLTNWAWNFGDVNSTPGNPNTSAATNPTHTFSATGNYTVSLTVITSNGCTNPAPFTKTVTINNRPKAGFIVPEVCINDIAAVFTDTSKIATGGFNAAGYEWNYGDASANTFGKDGSHLYTAVGQYTVRHIVTSTLGCKDTTSNIIFINGADPVANFSVSNVNTLCANDSVGIVNLSTIGQGSITKVEIYWDFAGAPAVIETDDFPVPNKVYKHKYPNFQAPLTRVYNIRFRAYSGTLCQDVKLIPVTVNAAPKVQFNAMPDACFDAVPFQITQASEVGGVPGTFVYAGQGVNVMGTFNPALAGIGTHTIKYTFTSTAAGCVDTISRSIKVLDTASAKFSFTSPVCEGTAATFKEESTTPNGVILNNTLWNFGDGSPAEPHAPGSTFTHNFPGWGGYTVTMYNTSAYGCRSTSKAQQVYISPIPVTAFAFNETSVCLPNASVSFKNNSTIPDNSGLTYLWDFGDGSNTSTALAPVHVYTGTGPYIVKLTAKSSSNCSKIIPLVVDFIHPQPKVAFDFSKPGVCIGQDVIFSDKTDGLDGTVVKWNWDFGDLTKGNVKDVQHLYTTAKTYDVSLYIVNSRGCNSDTLTKQFTVNPYPVADAGPDRVVLEGGAITLQPIVTGNDLQYLWSPPTYLNNVAIATPTASNMLDDITYTLAVTGIGGCTAPPDKMFVKVLKAPKVPNTFTPNNDGINDFWKIEYLDTYPNNKVQVFTRTGQLVFESKGYKTPWNGTLNGKPLPVDTYYYIIEPENGRKPITGYVTILK